MRSRGLHLGLLRCRQAPGKGRRGGGRHEPLRCVVGVPLCGAQRLVAEQHPVVFPSARKQDRPLEDVRGVWARASAAAGLPAGLRIQ